MVLSSLQIWTHWSLTGRSLLGWLLNPFDMKRVVFDNFLDIRYVKVFQTHLLPFLLSPGISIFILKVLLLLMGNGISRTQSGPQEVLLSLLLSWSSLQWAKLGLLVGRSSEYVQLKLRLFYVISILIPWFHTESPGSQGAKEMIELG